MASTPEPLTPSQRAGLIEAFKSQYQEVVDALAGVTPAELDHRPGPGKWTAREVVHHLADAEMMSAMRLRLLLSEKQPLIVEYDQDRFAEKLQYSRRPIEQALAAVKISHELTAQILDNMGSSDWARQGWHTGAGLYTPDRWLQTYSKHAHSHAGQIREAVASSRKSGR